MQYYGKITCNFYEKVLAKNRHLIEHIEKLWSSASCEMTIEQLMAVEGNMREVYYKGFDIILDNPDFIFETRTKRPPKNFLNTLISFGNSFLYTIVLSEIYNTHLDPRIGYLHSTNNRRFTLNLDVAEIFKPIIIDRTIFTLIGRRMLTIKHFDKKLSGILLKDEGKKIFMQELDERLKTTIKHKKLGKHVVTADA